MPTGPPLIKSDSFTSLEQQQLVLENSSSKSLELSAPKSTMAVVRNSGHSAAPGVKASAGPGTKPVLQA